MSGKTPQLKIKYAYCPNCHKNTNNLTHIGCTKTNHPFFTKYSRIGNDTILDFIIIRCDKCGFNYGKVYINQKNYMYIMPPMKGEPEHMTYLRNGFIKALYKRKCKTCGRILIFSQKVGNNSDFCDVCYDFKEYINEQNKKILEEDWRCSYPFCYQQIKEGEEYIIESATEGRLCKWHLICYDTFMRVASEAYDDNHCIHNRADDYFLKERSKMIKKR